jgi:putative oxidoreductase
MTTAEILMIVGRAIFGAFFLIAGLRNFVHFSERRVLATNYGWPLPTPLLAIGFAVQLVGGLSLIVGLWPAVGALVLIAFLIAATPLYHNLFMFHGKERDPHLYLTLVNVTLCGGLLLVIADTL